MASVAPEVVNVAARTGQRRQLDPVAIGNPAFRANQLSPERRAKIQAALKREARRIGYRVLFLHVHAKFQLALLRIRFAALERRAKLQRSLDKLIARIVHDVPH